MGGTLIVAQLSLTLMLLAGTAMMGRQFLRCTAQAK